MGEGQTDHPERPELDGGSIDGGDADTSEFVLGAGLDFANPNSSLAPLYLHTAGAVAVVALALIFVALTYVPIKHTDVWAHLRFGEVIAREHGLPEHEPFAETFADKDIPLVNFYWLDQLGAYLLFEWGSKLGGPDEDHRLGAGCVFLGAAFAGIVTLRLGLLLLAFRRLCGSTGTALVGMLLVVLMSLFVHLLILRPQVTGELAFAALLVPLSRPIVSRRGVVLMPLIVTLWANCHGSFPIGWLLIGAFLGGAIATAGLSSHKTNAMAGVLLTVYRDAQVRRLALALVLCVAAPALLNPYGPALYPAVWQLLDNPNVATMNEWQRIPFGELQGWVFLGSLVLLALLVYPSIAKKTSTSFTPTQILLVICFGGQAILHARGMVWWTMVLPWVAVPHLHALFEWKVPALAHPRQPPNLKKTILVAMIVLVLLLWSPPVLWAVWGDAPVGTQKVSRETPLRAARFLREQYEADTASKLSRCVFTSETVGDYLLWDLRLDPPIKLTCYTHVHCLPPDHWQRCMRVKEGRPGWQAELDRWGVQFLVVEPGINPGLAARIHESADRWEIVPNMGPLLVARRKGSLPP
jgi:hypothetical protein